MIIGIDFDNTIVSYKEVFHRIAKEKRIIPNALPINKTAVRDYLRSVGQEDKWTLMQGEVYGLHMNKAQPYTKVLEFMIKAKKLGHQLFIISHKTKYPFKGPLYDLHSSAKSWISSNLIFQKAPLFHSKQIFYELTKEKKVQRIQSLGCDFFIDDLPEILLMPDFPDRTHKILFDPDFIHCTLDARYSVASSWIDIDKLVF
jgi:hypothetical protein